MILEGLGFLAINEQDGRGTYTTFKTRAITVNRVWCFIMGCSRKGKSSRFVFHDECGEGGDVVGASAGWANYLNLGGDNFGGEEEEVEGRVVFLDIAVSCRSDRAVERV